MESNKKQQRKGEAIVVTGIFAVVIIFLMVMILFPHDVEKINSVGQQPRSYLMTSGYCAYGFAQQIVNDSKYSNTTSVFKCTNEGVWIVKMEQSPDYWKTEDLGLNGTSMSYLPSEQIANFWFLHSEHKDVLISDSGGVAGLENGQLYKVLFLVNEIPHICKPDLLILSNGTYLFPQEYNLEDIKINPEKYGLIENNDPIEVNDCSAYAKYSLQAMDTSNSTINGKMELVN